MNDLLNIRRERIKNAFLREKTDKVPFLLNADAYIPFYGGVELKDITSYDISLEVHGRVLKELQPDCVLSPYFPQHLMLSPKLALLGGGAHEVGKNMIKQIIPSATQIMQPDEYPALAKDPLDYLLEELYPRRFKLLAGNNDEEKFGKLLQMLSDGQVFVKYLQDGEVVSDVPNLVYGSVYLNPADLIFDLLRNFTGIVGDVRRCPEQLNEAGLAMVDDIASIMNIYPRLPHATLFCPMHLPAFVKVKDYEKVYWPSFKKLTELLVEQGHNVMFYFEKNYSHLYDSLQELPKNHIGGLFEEDDIRLVMKKLGGTMTVLGGLRTNVLSYGTKQESIDHVKALIDDVGRDPGFVIAPDTPMIFGADAKKENLKAVADTIATYGLNAEYGIN